MTPSLTLDIDHELATIAAGARDLDSLVREDVDRQLDMIADEALAEVADLLPADTRCAWWRRFRKMAANDLADVIAGRTHGR